MSLNDPTQETFGEFIRDKRKEKGISAGNLAARINKSAGYLSRIENNQIKNPSASTLIGLSKELGFTLDDAEFFFILPEETALRRDIIALGSQFNELGVTLINDDVLREAIHQLRPTLPNLRFLKRHTEYVLERTKERKRIADNRDRP